MRYSPNTDTPIVSGQTIVIEGDNERYRYLIGSDDWFAWLEMTETTKFYCDVFPHSYTARKEKKRNTYYWYAYMKRNEKLYKVYMGRSEVLTKEHIMKTIPLKLDKKYWSR